MNGSLFIAQTWIVSRFNNCRDVVRQVHTQMAVPVREVYFHEGSLKDELRQNNVVHSANVQSLCKRANNILLPARSGFS